MDATCKIQDGIHMPRIIKKCVQDSGYISKATGFIVHQGFKLFTREERPYHRDYNQGYDESYDYQTGTSFYIVHEFVSARAKYQSVRRSTYRSCECTRCCNSDSHQNCFRVSTQLFRDCQANRAQQCRRSSIGHELG